MKTRDSIDGHEIEPEGSRKELRFVCPNCGSQNLRVVLLEAAYPTWLIDRLEVNPDDLDDVEVPEPEDLVYQHTGHLEGWSFECANEQCRMRLSHQEGGEHSFVEDPNDLARWLLKNCRQRDEDVPVTRDQSRKDN